MLFVHSATIPLPVLSYLPFIWKQFMCVSLAMWRIISCHTLTLLAYHTFNYPPILATAQQHPFIGLPCSICFESNIKKIPCLRIQQSVLLLNYILSSFTYYFIGVSKANFKILTWCMPYAIWNTDDGIEKIKYEYCLWTISENQFLPVPIPLCSTCRWTVETWTMFLLSGDSGNLICGNWLKLEPYLLKKYVAS